MSQNHGKFVWYELTTPDVAAATRFYGDLLGLRTQTMPQMGDYTFWNKPDGNSMGGMSQGSPPAWMC
ncbi:MAG: VOC family protein, partial [Deltaproteobacteria bacterium]|nr:VOC family protein [Deltaproteobacteria bacterium]